MDEPHKPDEERETVPQRFPAVKPPLYGDTANTAWLLECMMQIQQSIGELKASVTHLSTTSERQLSKLDGIERLRVGMEHLTVASREHDTKLHRIEKVMFAAWIVLALLLAVGGFLINKTWDSLIALLHAAH